MLVKHPYLSLKESLIIPILKYCHTFNGQMQQDIYSVTQHDNAEVHNLKSNAPICSHTMHYMIIKSQLKLNNKQYTINMVNVIQDRPIAQRCTLTLNDYIQLKGIRYCTKPKVTRVKYNLHFKHLSSFRV